MKIIVGVTGSIAAYRSPDLVKELVKQGCEVRVILTKSAENLVSARALSTFSEHEVLSNDVFDPSFNSTDHISWARWAERIVIYGATANFLARYASGLADDLLSLQLLATKSPVFVAPAMNPSMWEHAATQANVATLRSRGVNFVGPIYGTVACEESGIGHIADIDEIVSALKSVPTTPGKIAGKKILISAGPMQSQLDPARLLQNRSSGRMGLELARAARQAGADVTLLLGPVAADIAKLASSFHILPFRTVADYESQLIAHFPSCDAFLSVAAVLDFEIIAQDKKMERAQLGGSELKIPMRPVKDFVAMVAQTKSKNQRVIAFAAETGSDEEILKRAEIKLREKGADALVANPVREGLGPEAVNNLVWILKAGHHRPVTLGPGPKAELAAPLLAHLLND